MLVVDVNRENFEYDVHAIVQAFYPEEQVKVLTPETGEEKRSLLQEKIRFRIREEGDSVLCTLDDREYCWKAAGEKEGFKRFLYLTLSQMTGRTLPWGNLTGIRPTKIAYGMLDQGKSEEEIVDFYRQKYFVSKEKARLSVDIARRERTLLAGIRHGEKTPADSGSECSGSVEGYSLYIGIPFCPTTCLYCSFTSFPVSGYRKKVDSYIDCLIREMEYAAEAYRDKILDCVYIGGGTPTTLEVEQLDRLLTNLKRLFDFSTVKEFTVEAGRADSITEEKLRTLYRHGVDRISVNPQTMKQETLDLIGRKASVAQVEEAYARARRIGFDNINMDLILGLPGESAEDVRRTVDRIVELGPDSLTVHSLAVKRASRLSQWVQENGISMLCNTDETMEIAARGAERLGLVPYYLYRQKNMSGNFENVGYAREGKAGLYNILIMEEKQTIIAVGAGSISKRVHPDGLIERCENVKDVDSFIERIDEMIERKRKLLED
ncbi:MAG: coproporphyrinogen dehydrogenase HemZ [Lachnospiraceae bacterium]|nr:coproporphyrinogen dehydrogenase HemZ [Lachnospiraceae bacterium]